MDHEVSIVSDENSTRKFAAAANNLRRLNSNTNSTTNNTTRLCHISALLPLTNENDSINSTTRSLIDFRVYLEAAAYLALVHFNERRFLHHGDSLSERLSNCTVQLTMEMRDTRFSSIHAAQELQDILRNDDNTNKKRPFALLGAARSEVSQTLAILAGVYELPQISATSTSAVLDSDDESTPYFSRTVPTNAGDARAMILYLQSLHITHFGILFIQDDFGSFFHASLLEEAGMNNNMRVVSSSFVDDDDNNISGGSSISTAIQQLQLSNLKYFIGIFNPRTWKSVVREAYHAGIMGQDGYTWFLTEASLELTQVGFTLQPDEYDLAQAVNHVGVVLLNVPPQEEFEESLSEFQSNRQLQQNFIDHHVEKELFDEYEFVYPGGSLYQYLNYDAVLALGIAACEVNDCMDGPTVYQTLVNLQFQGVSGHVSFDTSTGTRNATGLRYTVTNVLLMNHTTDNSTTTVQQHQFTSQISAVIDLDASKPPVQVLQPFVYTDGTTNPPPDLPPLQVELNLIPTAIRSVGLGLGGFAMVCAIVFFGWTLRYRKKDVIRIAQPVFLCQVCLGALIFASSVIPMSMQEPSASQKGLDIACMTTPWLLSLGFITAFSALFSKTWRLNKLFAHGEAYRRIKIEAKDVMYPFLILAVVNITILVVWTVGWPLQWTRVVVDNYDEFGRSFETYGTCFGKDGLERAQINLIILLVVVDVLALVFANYQSYKARNLPTDFNESFYVAIVMAGVLEALILGVPILVLVRDKPAADFLIRSVLVTIISLMIVLPIFIPKYMQQSIRRRASSLNAGKIAARLSRMPGFRGGLVEHLEEGARATATERTAIGQTTIRRNSDYYAQRSSAEEASRRRSVAILRGWTSGGGLVDDSEQAQC